MMPSCYEEIRKGDLTLPLYLVTPEQLEERRADQDDFVRHQLDSAEFTAKKQTFCLIMASDGRLAAVWVGTDGQQEISTLAHLPFALPPGKYVLDEKKGWTKQAITAMAIGWGLGSYQFIHYKKATRLPAVLCFPETCDRNQIHYTVSAYYLGRTLINRGPHDMTPEKLGEEVETLAGQYDATVTQIVGEALLTENYPAVHTVGRASSETPRLIDLRWGDATAPKVTLVGKGVCFDTGGILVKPFSSMELMKKDMAGAAHAMALAAMIMAAKLPLRLRVLIPAVDNAISGNAYYPGDVITMRNGKTVEVGHTDAEGRLILADALTEAVSETPDLLIDFASLTGAARVALGPEVAVMFASHPQSSQALQAIAESINDPLWPLPLYQPYKKLIVSDIADLSNMAKDGRGYGGAITAALFLQAFVPASIDWMHFDVMGWNLQSRPGHPKGGELFTMRALFDYLVERFCQHQT